MGQEHMDMDGFVLGKPALVCRWRLAGGSLPLENRHLRALSRRTVAGEHLSRELLGWAKQHIEWTLAPGSFEHPDGVLMLIVDEAQQAAMTVGAYEPLPNTGAGLLAVRAAEALREAETTGVAPESLWAVREDRLVMGLASDVVPSGTADLVLQLASTLGIPVERDANLVAEGARVREAAQEVFLVSDEHGVVVASDACGPRSGRLAKSYERLLEKVRNSRR